MEQRGKAVVLMGYMVIKNNLKAALMPESCVLRWCKNKMKRINISIMGNDVIYPTNNGVYTFLDATMMSCAPL